MDAVADTVADIDSVAVGDVVGGSDWVPVPDALTVAVMLADAVTVTDPVGDGMSEMETEGDTVAVREAVSVGVGEGTKLLVPVRVPVGDTVGEAFRVRLADDDTDDVALSEMVASRLRVGNGEGMLLAEGDTAGSGAHVSGVVGSEAEIAKPSGAGSV
jgi:hypothetical protein